MNNLVLTLLVWQMTAVDKIKARREAGQGTLEYVGMVAVAAIIIAAVIGVLRGFDLGEVLRGFIQQVIDALG